VKTYRIALMLGATFVDEDDCSLINEDIANTRVATIDDALAVIRAHIDRDTSARRLA